MEYFLVNRNDKTFYHLGSNTNWALLNFINVFEKSLEDLSEFIYDDVCKFYDFEDEEIILKNESQNRNFCDNAARELKEVAKNSDKLEVVSSLGVEFLIIRFLNYKCVGSINPLLTEEDTNTHLEHMKIISNDFNHVINVRGVIDAIRRNDPEAKHMMYNQIVQKYI